TVNFFCKCNNPQPKPRPSIPVVNGKINNSVGSIINNSKIVNPYEKIPYRNEISVASTIGNVVNGLIKKPNRGTYPPADCNSVAIVANNDTDTSFFVVFQFCNLSCR